MSIFKEKITTQLVYDAIVRSDTITSTDLYKILQANTKKQQHDVRNAIHRLTYNNKVERVKRGTYTLPESDIEPVKPKVETVAITAKDVFFRHYLSALTYCSGRKRQYYALTFDVDGLDHESALLSAIIENTIDFCGNQQETGYEISETSEGMDSGNTYPQIEVGQL